MIQNLVTQEQFKEATDELKKSVSDGKTLVATAITNKGVATASNATFATMASNIGKISSGNGMRWLLYDLVLAGNTKTYSSDCNCSSKISYDVSGSKIFLNANNTTTYDKGTAYLTTKPIDVSNISMIYVYVYLFSNNRTVTFDVFDAETGNNIFSKSKASGYGGEFSSINVSSINSVYIKMSAYIANCGGQVTLYEFVGFEK